MPTKRAPRTGPKQRRPSSAALEASVALQLWALSVAFERRLAAELAPLGLSVAGFRLIGELVGAPEGLRVGTLAGRLGVKAPSVTAMVDRFEADGLVERLPDPDDARAARVRLAAHAPLAEGVAILERIDQRLLEGLRAPERAQLKSLLATATARLAP